MAEIKLSAEARDEFGKGAARRIRRANKVPAVIYGHGTDPIHITLPGHETLLALRQANVLLDLQMADGTSQLALPKQVQRDPIKGFIEHVDLLVVKRGEMVQVEVPVATTGEAAPKTLVVIEANTVTVEADASRIPGEIEVSIEGLEAGTQILGKDLTLPEGITFAGDPDSLVVNITAEISQEALDASLESPEGEGADAAAAEEPAEGADEAKDAE